MRRRTAAVLTAPVALAVLVSGAPAAMAAKPATDPVTYRPPVDAALVDEFRPPPTEYGAGNRGVDYATSVGQPVTASADGEVVFAGRIGASSHVTLLHDDGVRTSFSFLASTAVKRGQRVGQGHPVGTAGSPGLHFGARAGEAYVDPQVLLGVGTPGRRSYLVDDPDPTEALSEAQERHLLIEAIRGLAKEGVAAAAWLKERGVDAIEQKVALAAVLVDDAWDLGVPVPVHLVLAALRWEDDQAGCTPGDAAIPPPAQTRRIAILVGGLGSATGEAAVLDVDTDGLGFALQDVRQYSYRADGKPYGPQDTLGDIAQQGERLARLVATTQRSNPGVPVDVIAHSQGGLVARSAITTHRASPATVVTLATPHGGSDLATAGAGLDGTTSGHVLLEGVTLGLRPATGLDLNGTSIRQMSETSPFLDDLPQRGWPPTTHVVSIAARDDPIVPNHQSRLEIDGGAFNTVVVPSGGNGFDDHAALPRSPEATREIALALQRRPPACRSLETTVLDELSGRQTSNAQDSIGAALAVGALYVDARTRQLATPRS